MKLLYFNMKTNINVVKKECFHTVLAMDNVSFGCLCLIEFVVWKGIFLTGFKLNAVNKK